VLSDGAVPPLTDLPVGNAGLQFVRIGNGNNNLAITAMDVRRDYSEGSDYQIFATVHNYSKNRQTVNLELLHEGNLVAVRPLSIAPGEQQSELFANTNFKQGLFSVRFDANDDLQSDNIAYANLEPPRNIRVLLISNGNLFLEKALNIDPNVQLFRAAPGAASSSAASGNYDVVVVDGEAPPNLPVTNQLVFGAVTALSPVTKTGIAAQPGVADWDRRHPVTRFAPWSDVQLGQSLAVNLKPWGQALVEAERTPLIVAGERGGKRVVWCGFLLRETDLPLKIAFPIFITNTLRWLSAPRGASAAAEGAPRRAGETVPLDAPAGVQEVTVTGPDKSTRRIPVTSPPVLYSGADQVGVYTAVAGSGKSQWKQTFAVSLLNKAESDLQPRDALQIGDETNKNKTISAETRARANRELWGYLALAALGLLGLEWWVYHRGV
jgi:hypothetical protein